MANRYGHKYYVAIVPESNFGTAITDLTSATNMFDVTCDIKNEPIMTDTKIKTGTTQPKIKEKIITGNGGSVSIKGNLCSEYDILLKAYTHDTSSPYTMQEAATAPISYTIYRLFDVGNTESTTPYDIATGCVLTSLKISADANGIVQFDATFDAAGVDEGITTAITNEATAWGAGTPFLFASVTATLFNSKTKLNSFAINLDKQLADSAFAYQNSISKTAQYLTGFTGTIDIETIYDDTVDPTYDGNIGSQTAVNNTLNLINASKTWAIVTSNRVASKDKADPDKGLFVARYTLDIAGDDDTAALTVTVS